MKRFNLNLDDTIRKVVSGFVIQKSKFKRGAILTVAENNEIRYYIFITIGNETLAGVVTDCNTPECDFVKRDDYEMERKNQNFNR